MKHSITDMTHAQFSTWLTPIVNISLFESRERLVELLTKNADREALESEFREFYEGYCGLAFELEEHEESLLSILRTCDTHRHEAFRGPHRGKFRLRAANHYRVIYTFNRHTRKIIVHEVGYRSSVY